MKKMQVVYDARMRTYSTFITEQEFSNMGDFDGYSINENGHAEMVSMLTMRRLEAMGLEVRDISSKISIERNDGKVRIRSDIDAVIHFEDEADMLNDLATFENVEIGDSEFLFKLANHFSRFLNDMNIDLLDVGVGIFQTDQMTGDTYLTSKRFNMHRSSKFAPSHHPVSDKPDRKPVSVPPMSDIKQ